ncbi:hypothetical protein [Streptomyces sp. NPDC058667]|uniref:hypothetical protein n=1 Tax=Streptomyces sp. NPDC058667 TaxID=3346588 RepID=UPI00365D7558
MAEPDIPTLIADLKITVIQGHVRQILEHSAVMRELSTNFAYLKAKIDDIHKEVVKNPVTEYWEAAGFDGIAAGIEKLYEGEGLGTAINYWLSNGAGAFAAIIIGGIGVYLAGKLTNIQRNIQKLVSRDGLIRAYDADGNATRQSRTDVEARERRVANGGTSMADLPSSPDIARVGPLTEALEKLNEQVLKFNNRSTAFFQAFRKLPTEAKADKAAKAVKRIADAAAGINHAQLQPVAEGVNKINNSMRNADPRKVEKVAKATEKLKAAMVGFNPANIPKAGVIRDTDTAMTNLATATGTLRTRFIELRGTVQSLDQQLGGASA